LVAVPASAARLGGVASTACGVAPGGTIRRVGRPEAEARRNGLQARQRPATWFQQLAQVELEQSGQTLKSLAPAEPSRSLSSPQRSQNALP
jgi:hypothetical protein